MYSCSAPILNESCFPRLRIDSGSTRASSDDNEEEEEEEPMSGSDDIGVVSTTLVHTYHFQAGMWSRGGGSVLPCVMSGD